MPKSFIYPRSGFAAGVAHATLSAGVIWGVIAGFVIGAGISLSIGLFYSSAIAAICGVVAVSTIMGALFGYVISHLLEEEVSFVGRAPGSDHHRISAEFVHRIDLTDHRTLKVPFKLSGEPPSDTHIERKSTRMG